VLQARRREVGPGRSRGSFVSGEVEKRARLGKKEEEGAGGPNTDRSVEFGKCRSEGSTDTHAKIVM